MAQIKVKVEEPGERLTGPLRWDNITSGNDARTKAVDDRRKGRLEEDESYPELLTRLHESSLDGALLLRRLDETREIRFRRGEIVFARSSNPDDRLGEYLLRRGVLSVRDYLESAARIEPGVRQGSILCSMQSIPPDDLPRYVKDQMTEIVCSLFRWSDGEFEVRPSQAVDGESIVMTMPLGEIILKGVRRVSDWVRIWQGAGGSLETIYRRVGSSTAIDIDTALSPDEAHVLELVNGRLELARLLQLSYGSDFDTCRVLWALRLVGAIEPVDAAAPAELVGEDYALADIVEAYDRVFFDVHTFVTERIGELADHFMDRVASVVAQRHVTALRDVDLRNQGRVEYEQVLANLVAVPSLLRREQVTAALDDLLTEMLGLTARELGPEEEASLRERLESVMASLPHVEPEVARVADSVGRAPGPERSL